jgi:serine/threonine protein kinase/Flp pilus assembly protein TadD
VQPDENGATVVAAAFTNPLSSSSAAAAAQRAFFGLSPGDMLGGRYEILEQLGQGGMGSVYKAIDHELERIIALKTVRPDLASNAGMLRRLKQEILLARNITHQNVIRIHDIGVTEGLRFITMEYCEGEDLGSYLHRQGKVSASESIAIIRQICEGLEAAHKMGVIHRDLKPQNILISQKNEVRILDFGLARSLESGNLTRSGLLVGTPNYMSPEQALGDEINVQSDIYSVGLIWFELLIGRLPFKGETSMARLIERTRVAAPAPAALDPTIPPNVNDAIVRCLQIDPKLRFPSVTALLDQIGRTHSPSASGSALSASGTVAAPRPGLTRARLLAGGVLSLLLLSGSAYYVTRSLNKPVSSGPAPAPPVSLNPEAHDLALRGFDVLQHRRDRNSVQSALDFFNQALMKDQNSALAWSGIADASLEMFRLTHDTIWNSKALDAARQAVRRDPNLPEVQFALGSVLTQSGHYADALAAIQKALTARPDSADGYDRLGNVLIRMGRADEGLQALDKAVAIGKFDPYTHDALARAYYSLGRNDDALREFQREAELRPRDSRVRNGLAVIYGRQGRWNDCIRELNIAKDLQPNADIFTNLGMAYFYAGRFRESIPMFEEAVKLDPNQAKFVANLADAYRAAKLYEKAQEKYSQAIELAQEELDADPRNAGNLGILALCYARKGQESGTTKAFDYITQARKVNSHDNELIYEQAIIEALSGRARDALVSLKRALASGIPVAQVKAEPDLEAVRKLPDFRELEAQYKVR